MFMPIKGKGDKGVDEAAERAQKLAALLPDLGQAKLDAARQATGATARLLKMQSAPLARGLPRAIVKKKSTCSDRLLDSCNECKVSSSDVETLIMEEVVRGIKADELVFPRELGANAHGVKPSSERPSPPISSAFSSATEALKVYEDAMRGSGVLVSDDTLKDVEQATQRVRAARPCVSADGDNAIVSDLSHMSMNSVYEYLVHNCGSGLSAGYDGDVERKLEKLSDKHVEALTSALMHEAGVLAKQDADMVRQLERVSTLIERIHGGYTLRNEQLDTQVMDACFILASLEAQSRGIAALADDEVAAADRRRDAAWQDVECINRHLGIATDAA